MRCLFVWFGLVLFAVGLWIGCLTYLIGGLFIVDYGLWLFVIVVFG